MPDPILAPEVQAAASDAIAAVQLGQAVIADVKKGGATAALVDLPSLITLLQRGYSDVKAAIPLIKTGYQTTEFWLTASVFVINGVYTAVTHGKVLPLDLNLVLGGIAAVYTFARSMAKSAAVAVKK